MLRWRRLWQVAKGTGQQWWSWAAGGGRWRSNHVDSHTRYPPPTIQDLCLRPGLSPSPSPSLHPLPCPCLTPCMPPVLRPTCLFWRPPTAGRIYAGQTIRIQVGQKSAVLQYLAVTGNTVPFPWMLRSIRVLPRQRQPVTWCGLIPAPRPMCLVPPQVRINCPVNGWTRDHTDIFITSGPVTSAASLAWTPVATNISCPGPGPLVQDVTYLLPVLATDAVFAVRAVFRCVGTGRVSQPGRMVSHYCISCTPEVR